MRSPPSSASIMTCENGRKQFMKIHKKYKKRAKRKELAHLQALSVHLFDFIGIIV